MKWVLPAILLIGALLLLGLFFPHAVSSPASSTNSASVKPEPAPTSSSSNAAPVKSSPPLPVVMYDNNNHAQRDYGEAVEWLRQGAEAGNPDAQFNYGILQANGSGIPKNLAEGYYWLSLSARRKRNAEVEEARDRVGKQLDDKQRADVEHRVAAFAPKSSTK